MVCYELTSVLTTISAASASIVAILGGFIASKLISISGERNAVISKLKEIDDEIAYRTELLENAQYENDEDDALDFIKKHVEHLVEGDSLEEVYDADEKPGIEYEILYPFWVKAEKISLQFKKASYGADYIGAFNKDGIPTSIVAEMQEDEFAYAICKKIAKYNEQQHLYQVNPYAIMPTYGLEDRVGIPRWYTRNSDIINEQKNALGWLEQQKKHYENAKIRLSNPKGMKTGLWIFILFSVFCVVMPLFLSPFCTPIYEVYIRTKATVLGTFVIGLVSIFIYLIWLFHWDTTDD